MSADPRQTHRTYCVVRFYSSLFPCALLTAWQVERLLLRKDKKNCPSGRERSHLKMETFVLLMGLKETLDMRDIPIYYGIWKQKSYKTSPVLAFQTVKVGIIIIIITLAKMKNKCERINDESSSSHEQKSSHTFSDSRFCCFASFYETLNWTVVTFWSVCWTKQAI